MQHAVKGILVDGHVQLLEPVPEGAAAQVVVTFQSANPIDLAARNLTPEQAHDLRNRLSAFAEDWNRPEMDLYDSL